MRNSERLIAARWPRLLRPVVVPLVLLVSGCAHYAPDQLAYRDRLESGFLTEEDTERFSTPDAQRLMRSADANEAMQLQAQQPTTDTRLLHAVLANDVHAAKALLAEPGVSPNDADGWGNTAFLAAARLGNVEMLRLLLKAGADVNGRGGNMSPLAAAALHGQTQAVQLLLRQHADVNSAGANGRSPLLNALELDHVETVKALLAGGANSRQLNANGENVLTIAVRKNLPEMLTAFLAQGVPVDMLDREGHSALYWSAFYHLDALSSVLREHGAQTNQMAVDLRPGQPYYQPED